MQREGRKVESMRTREAEKQSEERRGTFCRNMVDNIRVFVVTTLLGNIQRLRVTAVRFA